MDNSRRTVRMYLLYSSDQLTSLCIHDQLSVKNTDNKRAPTVGFCFTDGSSNQSFTQETVSLKNCQCRKRKVMENNHSRVVQHGELRTKAQQWMRIIPTVSTHKNSHYC